MRYPNVLILSNACLSNNDSNGRTLRNFLLGWPIKNLAQFYLKNGSPDLTVCRRYYCITDEQALNAFLKGKHFNGEVEPSSQNANQHPAENPPKQRSRNPLTMLAREIIWNSNRWQTEDFWKWVNAFSPDVILLQAGDCGFLMKLARDLSKKYAIPLVIYNSEVYYFKEFNYFNTKGISKLVYPVFRKYLCSQIGKTIRHAAKCIYNCDAVKSLYDQHFGLPSAAIYTATEMVPAGGAAHNNAFTVSYLGNLGVGRHEALIEIADCLQEISKSYHLDVYGKIPNAAVQDAFDRCPGISYKGFVSYADVVRVMHTSDLLVHAENFSEYYRKDSQFAFSTKIADSLASGTCFLLYAPEEMACTQYLQEHEAAYVASDRESLQSILKLLAYNSDARTKYIPSALKLVAENHNAEKNAHRFQEILKQAVMDKNEDPAGKLRI